MKNRLKSKPNEIASPAQIRASYVRWGLVTIPGMAGVDFLLMQMYEGGLSGYWLQQSGIVAGGDIAIAVQVARLFSIALMGGALAVVLASRGAAQRGAARLAIIASFALAVVAEHLFFATQAVGLARVCLILAGLFLAAGINFSLQVRSSAAVLLVPSFLSLTALVYAFSAAGEVYQPEMPDGPHGVTVKL